MIFQEQPAAKESVQTVDGDPSTRLLAVCTAEKRLSGTEETGPGSSEPHPAAQDEGACGAGPRAGTLDPAILESLRELERAGSKGFLGRMVRIYIDDTGKRLEALRQAVDAGDAQAVRQIAHALKSSSGNVGASALARMFRELEAMGHTGETGRGRPLLDSILEEFDGVRSALQQAAGE
jgi:HPt (histidine-containing phosphotransfer) domain-containing protein